MKKTILVCSVALLGVFAGAQIPAAHHSTTKLVGDDVAVVAAQIAAITNASGARITGRIPSGAIVSIHIATKEEGGTLTAIYGQLP